MGAPAEHEPEHEGRIAKNAGVLMALTMASRVAGLVRDFCITHFFGAGGITDVFYMAFTIPNVMRRLVAEGTLTVTFQPDYLRVRGERGDAAARRYSGAVFGFVVVAVGVLAVLGVAAAPLLVRAFAPGFLADPTKFALTVELTRWMFPFVFSVSLVALSMAVLNAHDVYGPPALAPVVLNLAIIALTVVGALTFARPIFGVVAGVLAGGALQVLVQIPPLWRRGLLVMPSVSWGDAAVKTTLKGMVPGLFTLAVYQLNIIVLRELASFLVEGSVSWYYTSNRLMELTNGVFAIAIAQGAFTSMSEAAARGDVDELKRVWRFAFKLQNLVTIPAAVGLAAVATPIVSVLFLHGRFASGDVEMTSLCLVCAAPGLVATATIRGTAQVFYALQDRVTPALVGVAVVAVNLALGASSMKLGFGIAGLAATLSVSSFVQAGLLTVLLRRKLGELGLASVAGAAAAKLALGLVAGGAAWGVARLGDWRAGFGVANAAVLFGAIALAVAIYGAGALAVGFDGVDVVKRRLLRR